MIMSIVIALALVIAVIVIAVRVRRRPTTERVPLRVRTPRAYKVAPALIPDHKSSRGLTLRQARPELRARPVGCARCGRTTTTLRAIGDTKPHVLYCVSCFPGRR